MENEEKRLEEKLVERIDEWDFAVRQRQVEKLEELETEIWELADALGLRNPWGIFGDEEDEYANAQ